MPSSLEARMKRSWMLILAGAAVLSVVVYLLVSRWYYRIGFPLDDAWIHQTYARNLALHGEWAFLLGEPSGGSTAPLWSMLLAFGFLVRLAPYIWTYSLGAAILWGVAALAEIIVRRLVPAYQARMPWAGLVILLEWHLSWSAVSGMETLLYALLVVLTMAFMLGEARKPFALGLLIGLSVWVRPDGITLLGPAILVLLLAEATWLGRLRSLGSLGLGFGSLFALYLLFNLKFAGSPWPSTFYAKQAEYEILQRLPIWERMGMEAIQPLVGVGIALLPGFGLTLLSAVRRHSWGLLASAAWLLGYIGLYAWRLPVTYQHARYLIPAMPVLFILGLAGLIEFICQDKKGIRWIVGAVWQVCVGLILFLFWIRGAYAYAQDVAVIESEMVTTARWVSMNLPGNSLVAAHDIGALGYFGNHDLVDLAGLVSPEVIPFLRDETRLGAYLDARQVDYLVTFPSWYPLLTQGRVPVFTTGAPFAPSMGEDNMAVYRWLRP